MAEGSAPTSRRSNAVTLTLVGVPLAVVFAANVIPEGQRMRRNVYADRAACERDYSPQQCEPETTGTGGSGTGGHGYYHGPYYSADRSSTASRSDPGPGRTGIGRVSYQTTTRGGFGSFGRTIRAIG
jgi:hypothetical protein